MRRLRISHAAHSPFIEVMQPSFAEVLGRLTFREPTVALISDVTGAVLDPAEAATAEYWLRHLREPVRFADSVQSLYARGVRTFVEFGPDGVLSAAGPESVPGDADVVFASLLRKDKPQVAAVFSAVGQAWAHGTTVDWSAMFAGTGARRVDLPTYAFQRRRFWPERLATAAVAASGAETDFWRAVEGADLPALAGTLDLAEGDRGHLEAMLPTLAAWRRTSRESDVVDSWRHRVGWAPVTVPPGRLDGRWLLVGDPGTPGADRLAAALTDAGAQVETVPAGPDRDPAAAVADAIASGPVAGVLSLLGLDDRPHPDHPSVPVGLVRTLDLVQTLGAADGVGARLWSVTRGAVATGRADARVNPEQAMTAGLGRVAALEAPQLWGGTVDLPADLDERAAARVAAVLAAGGPEDQVAVRPSGILARRLTPAPRPAGAPWRPRGSVLVTGGTGGLGAVVARHLARAGADRLVLTSRRGADAPGADDLAAELTGLGVAVEFVAADVDDRAEVARVLAVAGDELTAVVHAAGVDGAGGLGDITAADLAHAAIGKVTGARHLDELLGDRTLDAFVLFSSIAGIWGNAGGGAYAAANAHLDALAADRRARGLAGTAIAWGPWAEVGMATRGATGDQLRRRGMTPMPPAAAVSAIAGAAGTDDAGHVVVHIDWSRFTPVFTAGRPAPLLDELPQTGEEDASGPARGANPLLDELSLLPAPARLTRLTDLVRAEAAAVLGHDGPGQIGTGRAFRDIGFDSLTAVELRNRLQRATGLRLAATLVFDHPHPEALAAHLRDQLTGVVVDASTAVPAAVDAGEPLAIVAMSCRFPGGIENPEQLWAMVEAGADVVSRPPDDRGWDPAEVVEGGFLRDAAGFDAAFFGISPREALAMDPQQRLMLESAWEVFERAGIDPSSLRGSRTGVFVGASFSQYAAGLSEVPPESQGYFLTGMASSVTSGRLSYTFGLEGPAVTIDTACSSSLVALHLAGHSLQRGECDLAVAGGVTVMATAGTFAEFDRHGGLAGDGRCKSFADGADGTGWAEGVGLIALERLSDARRHGHPVLAVVRGTAVNQDGASNGLTAPSGPAQERVIRQALATAGLTTADVDAVEAHGTGTTLGDPIEAGALLATYGQERPADRPLRLGSIKSNMGHTQSAAGVAGVIKMVQALRHGLLPATLHADQPSPHVDWASGAVTLLTEPAAWPAGDRTRRAGVSSFGISGTNAHVILEEAPPADEPADTPRRVPPVVPVTLSGHDETAVRAQAARLAELLTARPELDLADVALSLAAGRAALPARTTLIAGDRTELLAALAAPTVTTGAGGRTALLFTGQGAQRPGMAAELYREFPAFADAFDEICAHLDPGLDRPLRDVVFAGDAAPLDETLYTQAALFAVEAALFRLLTGWGVRPDLVAGHSIGEVTAAYCAGVWDLPDAARLVLARGRLMGELPAGGAMIAIQATEEELGELPASLGLAAVNAPASVVVSGPEADVVAFAAPWAERGRKTRRLRVGHGFHSPLMEPMLAEFRAVVGTLTLHPPAIALARDVSEPEYWVRHVRDTVRFADDVAALYEAGVRTYVEIGPDGILSALGPQALPADADAAFVPALRVDRPDTATLFAALGTLWARGGAVRWPAVFDGTGARRVDVPTYAFQRQRYWIEPATGTAAGGTGAEAAFWTAVERTDLPALAGSLALDATGRDDLARLLPALSAWRRGSLERDAVDAWRYRITWKPVDTEPARLDGRWLVAGTRLDDALTAALTAHGADVVPLTVEPGRDTLADALRDIAGEGFAGVLSVYAGDEELRPDRSGVTAGLAANLALVQALDDAAVNAPLWLVTSGAVTVGRNEAAPSPAQAQVWGLGQVIALEQPYRWGGLVDLRTGLDARAAARLAAVLAGAPGEEQVAIRATGVYGRRLVPAPRTTGDPWRPRGAVLVTGGTGGLGAAVSRWLAAHGATTLVLTSRRGAAAPAAVDLAAELAGLGVTVRVVACDVADRDAAAALVADLPADLSAVVHTAGVDVSGLLSELGPDRLAEATAAKSLGAAHLDALLGDRELDAFVLYSSVAGVLGSGGAGAYAAANAYLDALAANRRARGLAGTAVAWGPWAGAGMASVGTAGDQSARRGFRLMRPETAVGALSAAVGAGAPAEVVADVDWQRLVTVFGAEHISALLHDVPAVRDVLAGRDTGAAPADDLAGLSAADRLARLTALVRGEAAAVLGHADTAAVPAQRAFRDVGFDSLTAVELRNRLTAATGLPLTATVVFDHPHPAALAAHLAAELGGGADAPDAADTGPAATDDEPIAIVAMSCRFAGDVDSPEDLWRLLDEGRDAVTDLPADRGWPDSLYHPDPAHPGTTYARTGCFLPGAGDFDAGFFGISPREAVAMDPQQRLLLETSWEALERAGLDADALRGSRTGVFVGVAGQDYPMLLLGAAPEVAEGFGVTGNAASVMSGRLSYTFGFEGPAITVDTACSSSLVALHLAAQALRRGECSLALAGGVTVMSTPFLFIEFSRQRGLAPDGRCKPFADAADGTGWGEGAGMLLLERLSDAQRNGHRVLAVLRGSAVNQDGASNGLTAPNGPSQQRVIRQALTGAKLTPADVDVVEAHGTGTTLGDPIEAQALLATYGRDRDPERPLWLGSVKSNIGHTQGAAGVAGVIKMVLAMRHEVLPRTLHVDEPSRHVDWSTDAVRLLTAEQRWPAGDRPRRAAVSSFGVSGTNAHVVLEEAPPAGPVGRGTAPTVLPFVLSAVDEDGLRDRAQQLGALVADEAAPAPADLAYALATGRAALPVRGVVVAADHAELRDGLATLRPAAPAAGRTAFVFTGQGAQRAGMGRELYDTFPVYADAFDRVCAHFELPLRELVLDGHDLAPTGYAQPALFAYEVAMFRLLESWGVRPDVLAGHSIGELAAAHCAGLWNLADACRVVEARGALMQALPPGGAMAAIQAGEAELAGEDIDIAAVNSASSVVVSGPADRVEAVVARFADRKTHRLDVSHAFHSALMEPMLDDFRAVVSGVTFHEPVIELVKDVSDAEYWVRHVRDTVRFADDVAALADAATVVEVGPDTVLLPAVAAAGGEQTLIAVARTGRPEVATLLTAAGQVWAGGGTVAWPAVFGDFTGAPVDLPTYPFRHERYWPETTLGSAGAADLDADFWTAVERDDLGDLDLAADQRAALRAALPVLSSWRRSRAERDAVDGWRYRETWAPVELPPAVLPGRWLLVTAPGIDDPGVAAALRDAGAEVVTASVDRLPDGPFAGVVSLLALLADAGGDVPPGLAATADLLRRLPEGGRLWCVTRGAVAAAAQDSEVEPAQTSVWGLGRVVALELPHRWGGLIDLPATVGPDIAEVLAAVLAAADEDQVALRPAGVLARRLTPAPAPTGAGWQPRGAVLVTGGTGGLGAVVARWLAAAGAEHLVLTSRRGPMAPGTAELAAELTGLGVRVDVAACDVADRAAVAAVLATIPGKSLTAVVHAAGVSLNAPIAEVDLAHLAQTAAGKVAGAANLDALLGDEALDAFVLFSSIAATWGSGGSGAYAAANAYLDGLAARRQARGLAGTAVAWGPWAEVGMVLSDGSGDQLTRRGLGLLPPDMAVDALAGAVGSGAATETVADVDWSTFLPLFTSTRASHLLAGLAPVPAGDTGRDPAGDSELRQKLAVESDADRQRSLLQLVRDECAAVLGHRSGDRVDPARGFLEIGFDSFTAIELRNRLQELSGASLASTVVFDHPSPKTLATHLHEVMFPPVDPMADVLGQIDLLADLLGRVALDDLDAALVSNRIQTLRVGPVTVPAPRTADAVSPELGATTADDLFAIIQDEFGKA
ncbi:type I polyketide synthase [Jidongwangia harbinensis]|uniref:type I polyketide synthase n=1 Tax=Jidongwangia harbinensis TaxID=2878561 RepID=UPI001CDA098C|nr:type I polyketide synthase [Jidongwangia harbinensis]MCA2219418.1 SDR family NAD(P)-dependent oxidoreductase [Jidongwangia harbinensis]